MRGIVIGVNVRDGASPYLIKKMDGLTPERLAAKVGPALQDLTRIHLGNLPRNSRGWPTTRFYENFVDKVQWLPHPLGVMIAIAPAIIHGRQVGLGLRVFGGTITAQTAESLVIAISPVSYGKVPSDFKDLFLLRTKKGAYLCQRGEQISATGRVTRVKFGSNKNERRRLAANLNFLFKLIGKSVDQEGDRTVLPSKEEYGTRAIDRIAKDWREK